MPYANRSELPDSVKNHLPPHAQGIYKEAFNSAWEEYKHDESRAHRVAWGAVKKEYHDVAVKIARPVARQADGAGARHFTSDCPMAAAQIAHVAESVEPTHPIELLRRAYGI